MDSVIIEITSTTDLASAAKEIGVDRVCKHIGLSGLKEATELTGHSKQTLRTWSKSDKGNKHKSFNAALRGAVFLKGVQNAER